MERSDKRAVLSEQGAHISGHFFRIDAKRKGKKPPQRKVEKPNENVVNLAEVLRKSLAEEGSQAHAKSGKKGRAA